MTLYAITAYDAGVLSAVAGQADILVAPDLESGNMIARQLSSLADALTAGVVLARVGPPPTFASGGFKSQWRWPTLRPPAFRVCQISQRWQPDSSVTTNQ